MVILFRIIDLFKMNVGIVYQIFFFNPMLHTNIVEHILFFLSMYMITFVSI